MKNIRGLARKPCRKALRAKAKSPGILKRAQLRFQHRCRIFAILHAAQQRLHLFCNDGSHGSGKRRFAIGNRALRVRILAKQNIKCNRETGKLVLDFAALLSRSADHRTHALLDGLGPSSSLIRNFRLYGIPAAFQAPPVSPGPAPAIEQPPHPPPAPPPSVPGRP